MERRNFFAVVAAVFMGVFAFALQSNANEGGAELKTEADFNAAIEASKADGKVVMLEFTGSDWCPPCKMLHKFVTDTKEFAEYANANIHLVVVDLDRSFAPKNKAQSKNYIELMRKYQIDAVPTIILINAKTGKQDVMKGLETRTPEELIKRIKALQ